MKLKTWEKKTIHHTSDNIQDIQRTTKSSNKQINKKKELVKLITWTLHCFAMCTTTCFGLTPPYCTETLESGQKALHLCNRLSWLKFWGLRFNLLHRHKPELAMLWSLSVYLYLSISLSLSIPAFLTENKMLNTHTQEPLMLWYLTISI